MVLECASEPVRLYGSIDALFKTRSLRLYEQDTVIGLFEQETFFKISCLRVEMRIKIYHRSTSFEGKVRRVLNLVFKIICNILRHKMQRIAEVKYTQGVKNGLRTSFHRVPEFLILRNK